MPMSIAYGMVSYTVKTVHLPWIINTIYMRARIIDTSHQNSGPKLVILHLTIYQHSQIMRKSIDYPCLGKSSQNQCPAGRV